MMSKKIQDRGTKGPSVSGVSSPGLEGALTVRAVAYLRSAHGMVGEVGLQAATLAARRALAATPHWRLERAGLAVIEEAARLAKGTHGFLDVPLMVLPEGAPRAMPEQNLDRAGLGDLLGGTRRARRRLRVRLRAFGVVPALVLAALVGLLFLPGLPH
ncbi:MAG: hypothetical protein K9H25_16155 [Rhodospirillum sp.]|nr:hypothetical protein [Rhodospirillum sp.]MCF8489661.1 hypothetical protein [Rhodospirillum sp.]MCF8502940.1 hypothetical protein [Rhodospirillum sp.]